MTRLTAVGIALLLCLVIGLTQEPDSGTAASVGPPDIAGAIVGANHAKPLPNVRSVTALLALWQVFTPVLLALGLLARLVQGGLVRLVATESDAGQRPSVPRSRPAPAAALPRSSDGVGASVSALDRRLLTHLSPLQHDLRPDVYPARGVAVRARVRPLRLV